MQQIQCAALAATALLLSASANATVLMSNNFDAENGGVTALNYTGFSNMTVASGSVDLVGNGAFGVVCAGNAGACVDLDGTTRQSGVLQTATFSFNAGDRVDWSFDVSGNQRGGGFDFFAAGFVFGGPTLLSSYSLTGAWGPFLVFSNFVTSGIETNTSAADTFPFLNYGISFVAGQAGTFYATLSSLNSNDDFGAVADNVLLTLDPVPEPATWAMMIAGFAMTGFALRRHRAVAPAV